MEMKSKYETLEQPTIDNSFCCDQWIYTVDIGPLFITANLTCLLFHVIASMVYVGGMHVHMCKHV